MKTLALSSALTVLILETALSGEPQPLRYTGNAGVDFFGARSIKSELVMSAPVRARLFQDGETSGEKSPWLAGALSLAVPGAGELYTGSPLKGAMFFALEVTSWVVAYTYNKKGDHQTDVFQEYANLHYSAIRYALWLKAHVSDINPDVHASDYRLFYNSSDTTGGPPFHELDWVELNRLESEIGDGFTHQMPAYSEQQYYELIGKYNQFSRGWDDTPADPAHITLPVLSTSKRFYEYADMRALANHYYDVAGTWVVVAVLNHIVSAVDAAWTAARHNSALHLSVNTHLEATPAGPLPAARANIQYTF